MIWILFIRQLCLLLIILMVAANYQSFNVKLQTFWTFLRTYQLKIYLINKWIQLLPLGYPAVIHWISSCYTLDIMMFYIGYLARIHWTQSCYKLDIQLFCIGYPAVLYWISSKYILDIQLLNIRYSAFTHWISTIQCYTLDPAVAHWICSCFILDIKLVYHG